MAGDPHHRRSPVRVGAAVLRPFPRAGAHALQTRDHGTVIERVDGPPYRFLRLETDKGQVWAAVPIADVPDESRITVRNRATLKDFESKQRAGSSTPWGFGVLEKRRPPASIRLRGYAARQATPR